MAIADDWTIDYENQRVYHSSGTTVYTVNKLYSYLMDTFDEFSQLNDLDPMSAQTPTNYTLINGWFMDETSFQYLSGGAIKTLGWDRVVGTTTGIVQVTYSGATNPTATDIGLPIVHETDGDSGILLSYNTTTKKLWIRPDSSATANNFDSTSGNLDITGGTQNITQAAAAVSGENLWANIYTLGTIESNTDIYVIQNNAKISAWWSSGHIDILVLVKETDTEIDGAKLIIFARQYSKLYDYYESDVTSGGRNPIPLATSDDFNNSTGYLTFTGSSGSDTFLVDEAIQKTGDSTIKGFLTAVGGTTSAPILDYYLIGSSLTPFVNGNSVDGLTSGAHCTAGTPADKGPAASPDSTITTTFGATSQDLNNGNGLRPYDVTIDAKTLTVSKMYERLKYVTRRGEETVQINGHNGEQYLAVGDIRLPYDDQTADFGEGQTLTGGDSDATGIIVADHDDGTTGALILRDVEGTFEDDETITDDSTPTPGSATANIPSGATTITPSKTAPFGTFAGGKFFGARGVWITNYDATDANSFELVDSEGVRQTPPATIAIKVTGVESGDRVSVFKATGDNNTVERSMFNLDANQSSGVSYIRVEEVIPSDTPATGYIRVVRRDGSSNILGEERYTYASWNNDDQSSYSTFVLSGTTSQAYDTDDTAYVPYIDEEASGTSISKSVTYFSNRYVTTRVRKKGIIPFIIKGQIISSGLTVSAIRTEDSIAT